MTVLHGERVFYKCPERDGMFYFEEKSEKPEKCYKTTAKVWHHQLNHPSPRVFKEMQKGKTVGLGVQEKETDDSPCVGCAEGKFTRTPVKHQTSKTVYHPVQKLAADCVGPFLLSKDKKTGALIASDAATGFAWTMLLSRKSEVPSMFKNLIQRLERQFLKQVQIINCDNGTEFRNYKVSEALNELGIQMRFSIPFVKEENGQAERMNRTLVTAARALLKTAKMKDGLWSFFPESNNAHTQLCSVTASRSLSIQSA